MSEESDTLGAAADEPEDATSSRPSDTASAEVETAVPTSDEALQRLARLSEDKPDKSVPYGYGIAALALIGFAFWLIPKILDDTFEQRLETGLVYCRFEETPERERCEARIRSRHDVCTKAEGASSEPDAYKSCMADQFDSFYYVIGQNTRK